MVQSGVFKTTQQQQNISLTHTHRCTYIFHSKSITNVKFMDKPIYKRTEMDHTFYSYVMKRNEAFFFNRLFWYIHFYVHIKNIFGCSDFHCEWMSGKRACFAKKKERKKANIKPGHFGKAKKNYAKRLFLWINSAVQTALQNKWSGIYFVWVQMLLRSIPMCMHSFAFAFVRRL